MTLDVSISKRTIDGDFNGDGLTDVMVIENYKALSANDCNTINDDYGNSSCNVSSYAPGSSYTNIYIINLDKRVPNASSMLYVGQLTNYINGYFTEKVLDFNGDGRLDFIIIESGKATVYSLNHTNVLVVLCTIVNGNIKPLEPFLIGDYNGDGKSDFIVSNGMGTEYTRCLSNGISFVTSTHNYFQMPYNGTGNPFYRYFVPNDINGDGKTDLIWHFAHSTIWGILQESACSSVKISTSPCVTALLVM